MRTVRSPDARKCTNKLNEDELDPAELCEELCRRTSTVEYSSVEVNFPPGRKTTLLVDFCYLRLTISGK